MSGRTKAYIVIDMAWLALLIWKSDQVGPFVCVLTYILAAFTWERVGRESRP